MRTGDLSIQRFHTLEDLLRRKAGVGKDKGFSWLVDTVARRDPLVRRHREIS